MRPKLNPSASLVPHPGRLTRAELPLPAPERIYSYFVFDLPSDITAPDIFTALAGEPADLPTVLAERAHLAFTQAQELSRTWRVPAWWHIIYDDGNTVVVRRISQRPASG